MVQIHYADNSINVDDGETVLDALLRTGFAIPHGCKAGACQSCMLQAESDQLRPPAKAQSGLKESQKALGYFLACQCQPDGDMHINSSDDTTSRLSAEVVGLDKLSASVMRLRLQCNLSYFPGQYINLWKDSSHCRSYSIASLPLAESPSVLELHIKILPNGFVSQWIVNQLKLGDTVDISGPLGQCFYTSPPDAPMLLLAMGTGLAPIYGVLQDALSKSHSAPINLCIAARRAEDLYYRDELENLAQVHKNLSVHFLAQETTGATGVKEADIYTFVQELFPVTKGHAVYLCGGESFVKKMKKQVFLAGASMKEIYTDAFIAFA